MGENTWSARAAASAEEDHANGGSPSLASENAEMALRTVAVAAVGHAALAETNGARHLLVHSYSAHGPYDEVEAAVTCLASTQEGTHQGSHV